MTAPEPMTVFVVDDDEAVRNSLAALLSAEGYETETFPSARAFLDSYVPSDNCCLIADIRMPDMDGLQLQEELNRRQANLPIIVVTGHGDVPLAVRAMKAGAIDFLEKPYDEAVLLASLIRCAQAASSTASQSAANHEIQSRLEHLTERERQVLQLLAAGKPNKVIAYELTISPRTVEIHRARVMEKMRASSLAELVRMVVAIGSGP
ncbi:MAG: response regulator transcription factor [Alphaproteobacteria bacterium]|nr:response regulator transcription factor [Alphaproteobacteria bacterium]